MIDRGQGGLLGFALDPNFRANRRVYLSFSEARDGGIATSGLRPPQPRAEVTALEDFTVIFR